MDAPDGYGADIWLHGRRWRVAVDRKFAEASGVTIRSDDDFTGFIGAHQDMITKALDAKIARRPTAAEPVRLLAKDFPG